MNINEIKEISLKEIPNRFNVINLCTVYKYITIKNELVDKGYLIDTSERENVFIEIITKNNPREIQLLEKYLEIYDLVQENMGLVKRYDNFFKNIENSDQKETDLHNFLASFN